MTSLMKSGQRKIFLAKHVRQLRGYCEALFLKGRGRHQINEKKMKCDDS